MPDEEGGPGLPSLPEGSQVILLTEEEYKHTLEGGGNHIPPPENREENRRKGANDYESNRWKPTIDEKQLETR